MSSPDVTRYVDLTLLDPSSQAIYQRALDYVRISFPEFEPREGTLEVVILQAMALQIQQMVVAINRLPSAITEVLLKLLDVERVTGAAATGVMKFSGVSTTSFTVPVGTRMYYIFSPSTTPILVETLSTITATHSKPILTISQTGTTVTVETTVRHGLSNGNEVTISGTGYTELNLTKTIANATATTFTYTADDSATRSANVGTVTPSLTIPATGFVNVQASSLGSLYNGLAVGSQFNLLSVIPAVASTSLATTLTGGADQETDDEYFTRAIATLSRLSTAVTTAAQAEGFVLDSAKFPTVYRAKAVDTTDGYRFGNRSGNLMIAVAPIDAATDNLFDGAGDGSLTINDIGYGVLDEIYDALGTRLSASLDLAVVHPSFVEVEVAATIKVPTGVSNAAAIQACQDALSSYLSANNWPWESTIRVHELIVVLRNATVSTGTLVLPAASYVTDISITPTDAYVSDAFVPAKTRFNISTITRTGGNLVTITLTGNHLIDPGADTLYIKVGDTVNFDGFYEADSASGSTFTFTSSGSNLSESVGYVVAAVIKKTTSGDLELLDPAPLVTSGTHTITTVT